MKSTLAGKSLARRIHLLVSLPLLLIAGLIKYGWALAESKSIKP